MVGPPSDSIQYGAFFYARASCVTTGHGPEEHKFCTGTMGHRGSGLSSHLAKKGFQASGTDRGFLDGKRAWNIRAYRSNETFTPRTWNGGLRPFGRAEKKE